MVASGVIAMLKVGRRLDLSAPRMFVVRAAVRNGGLTCGDDGAVTSHGAMRSRQSRVLTARGGRTSPVSKRGAAAILRWRRIPMSIIHPTKSRAAGLAGYGALALGLVGFLGVAPAPPAPASPRGQSTAATRGHSPRVDRLLAQMTLDDKLQMVSGGPEPNATNQYEAGYLPGIA